MFSAERTLPWTLQLSSPDAAVRHKCTVHMGSLLKYMRFTFKNSAVADNEWTYSVIAVASSLRQFCLFRCDDCSAPFDVAFSTRSPLLEYVMLTLLIDVS